MADEKKKSFFGTPLIILSFVLVFFILFDIPKGIRDGTAWLAGLLLAPVIGFGGRFPLLTIFLASVVLVVATTAIRHFLVDWTKMARVQEAMRSYTSEMREARKSNNTYKLKKLTDAQADVMQLQASVQTDQMKPMALTMLLVIPIFAWLGAFLAIPVVFDAVEPPTGTYALLGMEDGGVSYAAIVGTTQDSFSTNNGALAYAFRLEGDPESKPLTFRPDLRGDDVAIPLADAPGLPAGADLAALNASAHTFRLDHGDLALSYVDAQGNSKEVGQFVLFLREGSTWRAQTISTDDVTIVTGDAEAFAILPTTLPGTTLKGSASVVIDGEKAIPLSATNLVTFSAAGTDVEPIPVASPWNHAWDIMDRYTWITGNPGWFPRWIVLYSLFGIPFGQIAQRALKLWEYRRVDLDDDGKPAGQA